MSLNNFKFQISNFKLWEGGFSLVELLVSIAIIMVVSAVAVPSLRNFSNSQEIDGAANQLMNILKNAQSSAVSKIQCPSGLASTNWQVNLNITTNNYAMHCVAGSNNYPVYSSPFAGSPTSQTGFQAEIDRCGPGINGLILFINQGVSYICGSTPGTDWPVKITLSKAGSTSAVISIEQGGVIRRE